jgi:hypothetical protein
MIEYVDRRTGRKAEIDPARIVAIQTCYLDGRSTGSVILVDGGGFHSDNRYAAEPPEALIARWKSHA